MNLVIRSETVRDYPAVAEITALAFMRESWIAENAIVDAQRRGTGYDPDLALVAELDGRIIGHAFFYPHRMRINGETLIGVSLAPLTVAPDFQRQGIGTRLMEEGHRRAQARGVDFAFLLGHPGYYPRAGYQTNMFGNCGLRIGADALAGAPDGTLEARQVSPADLPFLTDLWRAWFNDVDLALEPGLTLLDWISHAEKITARVFWRGEQAAGYARYANDPAGGVRLFLARDPHSALEMARFLAVRAGGAADGLLLPVHPASHAARQLLPAPWQPVLETWDAAMIKILNPGPAICAYCDEVASAARPAGNPIYPPLFEVE